MRCTQGRLHASLRSMANLMLPSTILAAYLARSFCAGVTNKCQACTTWCTTGSTRRRCQWQKCMELDVHPTHSHSMPPLIPSPLNCPGVISTEFKEDFMAAPGWSQCTYQILAFIGQHEKRSALSEKIRFAPQGKKSSKPQSDNANCNDSCRKQKT